MKSSFVLFAATQILHSLRHPLVARCEFHDALVDSFQTIDEFLTFAVRGFESISNPHRRLATAKALRFLEPVPFGELRRHLAVE